MNLLEHYILEIHSVKDITSDIEKRVGHELEEPMLLVNLTCDCYGVKETTDVTFFESAFTEAKECGYYMA